MLLIGTFEWASTRLKGVFDCPECNVATSFRLKASRPFLTLYFIPMVPIGGLTEYVQCASCKTSFPPLVLANHMLPEGTLRTEEREETFEDYLLLAMAIVMVDDGQVSEIEISTAQRLYEAMTGQDLTRDRLGMSCSQVQTAGMSISGFLRKACELDHDDKLLLIQGMFGVAAAEGEITPKRMRSLLAARTTLQLDEPEFQRAIEQTSEQFQ